MNSLLAKILGWVNFGANAAGQVIGNGGLPHGILGWFGLIGSLAAAVGIHAASNVGKVSERPTGTTIPTSQAIHIKQ